MRVKFKQNGFHGCGLFAVANLFDMPAYITPERIEQSQRGNTHHQLSEWLIADGFNMYVSPLYFSCEGIKLTDGIYDLKNLDEQHTPLLISGQYKKGQLFHMVAALLDNHGTLTILDSFTGNVTETNFRSLNNYFEVVSGIYGLVDISSLEFIGFVDDWGATYIQTLKKIF